jgi:hypothetical protein
LPGTFPYFSRDADVTDSVKWVLDDIACCLYGFDFKGMGLTTGNPVTLPGEELQWDEYFFRPYYDSPGKIARIKELLQREGIFSDSLALQKREE